MNPTDLSKHMAKLGAKGGKATGASKARSPASARRAAQIRWAKVRAAKK